MMVSIILFLDYLHCVILRSIHLDTSEDTGRWWRVPCEGVEAAGREGVQSLRGGDDDRAPPQGIAGQVGNNLSCTRRRSAGIVASKDGLKELQTFSSGSLLLVAGLLCLVTQVQRGPQ